MADSEVQAIKKCICEHKSAVCVCKDEERAKNIITKSYEVLESEGKKEKNGKLFYEFDWEFIEEIAIRMQQNKGDKYPPYNWKKLIDPEDLKQAINRHHIEVMKGNYEDDGNPFGHVVAYACNAMMLYHQLKNNKK